MHKYYNFTVLFQRLKQQCEVITSMIYVVNELVTLSEYPDAGQCATRRPVPTDDELLSARSSLALVLRRIPHSRTHHVAVVM